MSIHFCKNKEGSAIAYGLIIIAVSMIILTSAIQYISAQVLFSFSRVEKERAFQTAEAGIYFYRWYLAHQVTGKTVQQIKDFWQTGNPYGVAADYESDYSDPGGGVIGKYVITVEAPDPNSTAVVVKSTGWTYKEPGIKRTIQVRFRLESWSEYVVLADDVMRFGSGTQVFGKIHSNYGIHFDGIASNVVSSSVYSYEDPDYPGNTQFGVYTRVGTADPANPVYPAQPPARTDVFQGGRQFPVPTVDFNGLTADLNFIKAESQIAGRGLYFDESYGGRRIIFRTDGQFDMCTVNNSNNGTKVISNYKKVSGSGNCNDCSGECRATYDIPDEGVIFVENNVWIEGTIDNSRVTVVAANLIGGSKADAYVGLDNLLYTNFDGTDVIGLIAQKDISVVKDAPNFLTIDAAILAQSGRVGQDHYPGYNRNTLTINGSLATKLRYGFSYTDGTGFANRILNYDNNLLYSPPPYFPTGTEYYIDLWDEI